MCKTTLTHRRSHFTFGDQVVQYILLSRKSSCILSDGILDPLIPETLEACDMTSGNDAVWKPKAKQAMAGIGVCYFRQRLHTIYEADRAGPSDMRNRIPLICI